MMTKPDYEGKGFYNVSQTVLEYFGVDHEGKPLDLNVPQNDGLALFLFDALGISTMEKAGLLDNPHHEITSVFPSTTATALTTLFTAKKPSEHGVLGFQTFVREMGGIVNMLSVAYPAGSQIPVPYEKLVSPSERIGKRLSASGVNCTAVLPKSVSNTPMSNFDDDGFSRIVPYFDLWDLKTNVERELEKPGRRFLYVYVPYVDTLSHHYGPYSQEAGEAARDLLEFFEEVAARAKGYTLLATADHGQVEVDPAQVPPRELLSLLELPPYGDSRAMFLKTRHPNEVKSYLHDHFPDFQAMTKEEVLASRIIGDSITPYEERLGDLLVLPQGRRLLIYPYLEVNEAFQFKGHHGGLSEEEQKIPLFVRPERPQPAMSKKADLRSASAVLTSRLACAY